MKASGCAADPISDPEVSVVVPHYGDPGTAAQLVSMLHLQEGVNLQIIVSDDHSPEPFPHIEGVDVIRRESNGGFGSAVNTGVGLARHDLLLVLNSDLEIGRTFVRDLVVAAQPWQPCVAGPAVMNAFGPADYTGRHFPTTRHHVTEWLTPLARWRQRPALHEAVGHDTTCQPGTIAVVDWLVGAALLLPTAALRGVGGFDELFFMNAEEVDLQRRLREVGVPSVYVGTVSAIHAGGGSSDLTRRRHWLVDGRMRYAAKWGGRRRLQAALGAATLANLAVNVGRRAAGRQLHPFRIARYELALIRGGR